MSEPVHILIVEDVPTDFELAQREIRKAVSDCVIQQVQTRPHFLRALETFQPDLILSDYHMPGFDGMSALKLAQEHAKLTPFIIWTGTMGEDVAVELMRAGAVNYILKDNIKRLGPAVAHALEERRLLLEHKRAEETIRNNEKRFRALIENGRDNISLLAVDGTLLWESPATRRSLGYAQDEFVGRNMFELMHPDDLKWTSELYAKLLQEPGSRQDGVFRLRHRDGSWRWNEATVTNMLNEPGVNAIVVNYRDITERKQAEDALRESQIKYENLVETSHDLIWSVDAEGRITFLNRAAKEIYGYEPEELIGHSFFEILDPKYYDRDLKDFKETIAQANEFRELEIHVRHREGKQIVLSSNSLVLHDADGNVVNITGSSHDITERKQAEEMLEKERNLLRTLIDHLPDRIYVMDTQGRKTLSNTADWMASGVESMEDVLGKTDFDTYPPEMAQEFWALDKAVLDSGEPVINYEEPGLDSEGNPVWVLSTKVPLRDSEGKVTGLVGIGRDITGRKRAEMERQTLLEIMQGLANAGDLQEFLKLIHHSIARVIYAENFFAVFYNKDSGLFEEIYSVDKYDEPAPPSALEKSITSYVFRSGEPLLLTQARFDELAEQGEVELVGTDSASWLGAPLKTQNVTIGVIAVQHYEDPNRYTERDRDFLALIGSQVALAIERKKVEAELAKQQYLLNAMLDTVPDYIYFKDIKSRFIRTSKSHATAFGLSDPAQVIGKTDFDFFTEEHARPAYEAEQEIIRTGQPLSKEERETWPDRPDTWVIATKMPLRNQQGEIIGTFGISKDITERKQAEEALRQSENRYSLASKATNDVIWEWDQETNQLIWNENAQSVFGYPAEEIGSYETWWEDHIHADDRGRVLSKLNALIAADETIWADEYRFLRRDGSYAFIIDHGYVERDASGKPLRVIGAMSDITTRKEMEDALRDREQHLNAIIENEPECIKILASDGSILQMNPAGLAMIEADNLQAVLGKSVYPIVTAGYRQAFQDLTKKVFMGESGKLEFEIVGLKGTRRWLDTHAVPMRNEQGDVTGLLGITRDITDRKGSADQLKYHARLLRHINDAVIATDDKFRINAWNRAAEKMYGWRSEDVLGHSVSEILNFELTEEERVAAREILKESTTSRSERIYRRRDGRTIYVEANTIALLDQQGRMTGYVSVHRDITERKQAEEKLHLSDQILQRVKALVLVADSQGTIVYVGPAASTILDYEPEELLGDNWWQVGRAEPLEAQREKEYLRRAASGEIPVAAEAYERSIHDRSGSVHWISWVDVAGPDNTLIGVGHDITERKRAEEQTELQLQRVRALHAIDIAISSSFDLRLTLNLLLDQAIAQLKTDAAAILVFHPVTRTLEHAASRGFRTTAIREARLRLGEGFAGQAIIERRIIHILNLMETDSELAQTLFLRNEEFMEYYCVPLIVKGEVKGVLEIFHRSVLPSDPDWLDFLETLAGQAAIAIDNATLFEDLQHSNRELFQAYDATIEGWSHALDLRDRETEGHTLRVTEMTLELARKFGFTDEQLRYLRWGALLHDIGKMGVPDYILLKPDKLTDEEWDSMKKHPVFALEMLSPIAYLKSSIDIPYCHHEKWDGTGYPRGLKGDVIPLAARLFAIVDVWDALRSDRPYREGWSAEKTLEHIQSLSGTHFDPQVVEYFLEMIERPNG